MRSAGDRNWPSLLSQITDAINRSPQISLGNLAPNDIKSSMDEPKLRQAIAKLKSEMTEKQREKIFPEFQDYRVLERNEEKFKTEKQKIYLKDYVYVDYGKEPMTKSFDYQVRIFNI